MCFEPEPLYEALTERGFEYETRGCASGIVRVRRALEDLDDGSILVVKSTDNRARTEYPQLAERTPHELIAITNERTGLLRTEYTTYLRIRET